MTLITSFVIRKRFYLKLFILKFPKQFTPTLYKNNYFCSLIF